MKKVLKFPKDFLWGSATSAYQIEGGILNCDWSEFSQADKACDHYHLYEKDFDLLKKLSQNCYRFSIEWSRIEPKEGKFDKKEIEHYKKVLLALKERNIKSFVTLWHFTNPLWLAKIGGWENKKVADYFKRYSKVLVKELKNLVDFWITLNEPINYIKFAFLEKLWPPQKKSYFLAQKVFRNFVKAHKKSYKIFHQFEKRAKVGLSHLCNFFEKELRLKGIFIGL
jgi:beta-glucosidase